MAAEWFYFKLLKVNYYPAQLRVAGIIHYYPAQLNKIDLCPEWMLLFFEWDQMLSFAQSEISFNLNKFHSVKLTV